MENEAIGHELSDWTADEYQPGLRIAPECYVIEDELLEEINRPLQGRIDISEIAVVTGEDSFSAAKERIDAGLSKLDRDYDVIFYEGECSPTQIERCQQAIDQRDPDLVVGVGGGKVLDLTKIITDDAYPCALIPTSAATCAAWTPISITYNEDGSYLGSVALSQCPEFVFIDTRLLVEAPHRLLASGIMDASAKYFETRLIPEDRLRNCGRWGLDVAQQTYSSTLREKATQSVELSQQNVLNDVVEEVIEATIVGPGLASGLVSNQSYLTLPHAFCYELTHYHPVAEQSLHGERVAYGVLVLHDLIDDSSTTVQELKTWFEDLGTELSLRNLGVPQTSDEFITDLAREIDQSLTYELLGSDNTEEDIAKSIEVIEDM